MKALALILIFATGIPSMGYAQTAPTGIGFAQAEEGTWWCRDSSSAKALTCALNKCRAESGDQECHSTRWCLPAGWSGTMVVWLPEFHSTMVLCGTSGEAALIAGLRALCDGSPFVTRCSPTTMIDPDGGERFIEGVDWPGPAILQTDNPANEAADGSAPPR